MADRSIQGIAVEIRGDYRKLQADMRAARKEVRASAEGMSAALNNALSPRQIETGILSLTKNLRSIKGATSLAGTEFRSIGADLADMRSQIGLSEKSFANLQSRILQTSANKVNDRAIQSISRAANLGVTATARLQRELGDTAGAFQTLGAGGVAAFKRVSASVLTFRSLLAGVAVGASMKSVFEAGRSYSALTRSIDAISGSTEETRRQMEYLQKTSDDLGQNFFGLAESYKSFYASSKQAGMATEDLQRIFSAFTRAGAVQGLPAEKMKYALMAVEQMISKGTVSMEELRRQLGDNLPGAFGIAADAMGVTVKEMGKMVSSGTVLSSELLPKMVDLLEKRFKGGADKSTTAANKLAESWQKVKQQIAESGFLEAAGKAMKDFTDYIKTPSAQENIQNLADGMSAIAVAAGKTAVSLGKVASILSSLPPEVLGALGGAAVGAKIGGGQGALAGGVLGGFSADIYGQIENMNKIKASVLERLKRERLQALDLSYTSGSTYRGRASNDPRTPGIYRGLVGQRPPVADKEAANAARQEDIKITAARNSLTQLRREIQIIVATQQGGSASELLGIDDAYLQRVEKLKLELADPKAIDGVKAILRQQLDAEKEKFDVERSYAEKRIALDQEVTRAGLQEQLAELSGIDTFEAQKASIRAKYAQARLQPNSQAAQFATAMQTAELSQVERERMKTLSQQDAEYAKLTYNSKAYYEAMLAEIKAGITGNETMRQKLILQKQMEELQAKATGDTWYAVRAGLDEFADSATDNFDSIKEYARSAAESMTDFFLDSTQDIGTAFENMANSILKDLARIIIQENITKNIASGVSGFIGDYFGSGSPATANARGGVYSGPGISAYSNSIVSSPTVFPFAKGIGLMGEAGEEAILPLTRNSGGKLVGDGSNLGGTNNYNAQISFSVVAMDATSFQAQLVQNKQAVVGIVNQAFNQMGKRGPNDRGR